MVGEVLAEGFVLGGLGRRAIFAGVGFLGGFWVGCSSDLNWFGLI